MAGVRQELATGMGLRHSWRGRWRASGRYGHLGFPRRRGSGPGGEREAILGVNHTAD